MFSFLFTGTCVSCLTTNINIQKLIKQTIFADHLALLIKRQDALLAQLTQIANEGFSKAKEEWEKNLLLCGKNLRCSPTPLPPFSCYHCCPLTLFIPRQTLGETPHRSQYGLQAPLPQPDIPLKWWMWIATVTCPWTSVVLVETQRSQSSSTGETLPTNGCYEVDGKSNECYRLEYEKKSVFNNFIFCIFMMNWLMFFFSSL